jgi:hypothetical protein
MNKHGYVNNFDAETRGLYLHFSKKSKRPKCFDYDDVITFIST